MGIWLKNIESLRRIEWGKRWLWDVQFADGPAPFNEWFPATDVEENLWSLADKTFTHPSTSFSMPETSSLFTISLTVVDDIKGTIEAWMMNWVNEEILGGGNYVLSLEDAVKELRIAKLNNQHELINLNQYWVVPKGEWFFQGTSSPDAPSDKLDFVVAGIKSRKRLI